MGRRGLLHSSSSSSFQEGSKKMLVVTAIRKEVQGEKGKRTLRRLGKTTQPNLNQRQRPLTKLRFYQRALVCMCTPKMVGTLHVGNGPHFWEIQIFVWARTVDRARHGQIDHARATEGPNIGFISQTRNSLRAYNSSLLVSFPDFFSSFCVKILVMRARQLPLRGTPAEES